MLTTTLWSLPTRTNKEDYNRIGMEVTKMCHKNKIQAVKSETEEMAEHHNRNECTKFYKENKRIYAQIMCI